MRCFEGLTHLVSSELEFGESRSSVHSVKRGGPKFQAVDNTCKGPVVGSVRGVFEGLGGRGCGWTSAAPGGPGAGARPLSPGHVPLPGRRGTDSKASR